MTLNIVGYLNVEIDGVCNKSQDAGIRDPSTACIHQDLVTFWFFFSQTKTKTLDIFNEKDICNIVVLNSCCDLYRFWRRFSILKCEYGFHLYLIQIQKCVCVCICVFLGHFKTNLDTL